MLIYKQELPMDTLFPQKVRLPFTSVHNAIKAVMKLDLQYDVPVMWYQADYEKYDTVQSLTEKDWTEDFQGKEFWLLAIGTGHDWKDGLKLDNYIGTVQLYSGTLVLHYFIVDWSDKFDDAEDGNGENEDA